MNTLLRLLFSMLVLIGALFAQDKPSQEELDKLLAPIALYPDNLLAQTLMASTYPLEIVEAARWSEKNKKLSGEKLDKELGQQSWDPSVKSLCKTPDVLARLNENLEWTQKLGNAFLADQKAAMNTVQTLRKKAFDAGNLKSSDKMKVETIPSDTNTTVIIIESPQVETVYVPTYNPYVVYGTWWYPYPPYYIYPPAYVYPPGFTFGVGIIVGGWFWGGCNWGHGDIDIDINNFNRVNHYNSTDKNWKHNAEHRRGVAYPNDKMARDFNRVSDREAIQSREAYRGKLDNKEMGGINDKAGSADRSNFSRARESGLSNIGNSNRINSVSQRGSFSRGGGMRGRR